MDFWCTLTKTNHASFVRRAIFKTFIAEKKLPYQQKIFMVGKVELLSISKSCTCHRSISFT